ncbi:hypothetical protein JCM6294_3077 [Bacteroides pyogenes DSM 20611 = JCM 6294]|uniref:Uncharacterized protein n=1 Tax=Bacteroides pyogenes DSM 20611 = JCM 6294 TaxID=1121100 RepID=W4PJT6_9BACE|nr:hypothetical protein JCM6294_3077 [Bacteroides pyogenes DSM 20611 = JCM 6294]
MGVLNGNFTRVYWKAALAVNLFRNVRKSSPACATASLLGRDFELLPQEMNDMPVSNTAANRPNINLFAVITGYVLRV